VPKWVIQANGSGEADIYPTDFSQGNLWVFSLGSYVGEKVAFAAHYQNGHWTKSVLPDVPESAAALSSKDIWVLGQALNAKRTMVMMHWNGRRWTTSGLPKQRTSGYPSGLTATGPRSLWLSWSPAKAGAAEYLLHWTGSRWAKVNLPAGDLAYPASEDGAGGLWLTGFEPGPKRGQLYLHWGSGHWKVWKVPNGGFQPGNVDELALIPGTRSLWAIGNVYGPGDGTVLNRGAIWRYNP
jgi:hypothetical protein